MATTTQIAEELRDQWALLRERLVDTADATLDAPSTLPGWTVRELVAHLGLSMRPITRCELGARSAQPLTFSAYLATYAEDAQSIAERVGTYSASLGTDTFTEVDLAVDQALYRVDELAAADPQAQVRTRRGVIAVPDFLLTRLLELVVHGYDLAPALASPIPVDAGARHLVAEALVEILDDRAGYRLTVGDEESWIKAATGRISWDEAVRRDAVRPEYLSDGVPDIAEHLPLF